MAPERAATRTRAPRRVLMVFLSASLAVHAAVLVFAPEFSFESMPAGPGPLEVIIEPPRPLPVAQPVEPLPVPPMASPPTDRPQARTRPKRPARPSTTALPAPGLSLDSPLAAPEPQPQPAPEPQPPAAGPQAGFGKIPATPPSHTAAYLRNPPPPYPMASRRAGEEGTVTLRVLVKRDGLPGRVDIGKSSGWHNLDAVARDAVWKWRFVPAREGDDPVDATMEVPITFRLKDAAEGSSRSR